MKKKPRKRASIRKAHSPVSDKRPRARAKAKTAVVKVSTPSGISVRPPRNVREKSRLWVGVDLSLHALALAGIGWDEVLKKYRGPGFVYIPWNKHDHYFSRITRLSKADYLYMLVAELNMVIDPQQIYIAIEEPWPFGLVGRGKGQSQTLKQQAELSGAFMAGCLRLGFQNIYQINSAQWRKLVADDLGITIHHTKWGKGIEGKMRVKQWADGINHGMFPIDWPFPKPIPFWPDLITDSKNGGRKPQPKDSKATPLQPDDRYQALPMAAWMRREERETSTA